MADKLETKLRKIEDALGGTEPTPDTEDKLGWHLDYIEELAQEGGGGTTVVANPEMSGDEDDLVGLQVGETKYKINDNVGSEVIANPILEGNEDSLSSIEIDGTKFKVETVPSPTIDDEGKLLSVNSNGNYFLDNKLLKTIWFEIPSSAWVSETHGVFNAKAEVTLANTLIADGSSIEAYFKDIENSAGVVLNSATQNNNDLDLIFYANEVKTTNVNGMLKYIYVESYIDPVLNNNDWATIRKVCESGEASSYWSVGDTKTDVGTDGNTRTFRIVDMQGLYGKHVVFEQVETEPQNYAINSSSSNNDYSTSQMRITHLPAIMQLYSSELQESLTNTTYKVAENGNSSTVLSLTDKLFLAAGKELWVSPNSSYFRDEENAALTTYQYYAANTASSYKIKQRMNTTTVDSWFLRSPCKGNTVFATYVRSEGTVAVIDTTGSGGTTPCFSF